MARHRMSAVRELKARPMGLEAQKGQSVSYNRPHIPCAG